MEVNDNTVKEDLTLEERYTEAMRLAGYEFVETPTGSSVPASFKEISNGRIIRFGSWPWLGEELKKMSPVNADDYKRFEDLIHPPIIYSIYLPGNPNLVEYPDFQSALSAYIDSNVDGRELCCMGNGFLYTLAQFNAEEMRHHYFKYGEHFGIKDLSQNEAEEIKETYDRLVPVLEKDSIYHSLKEGFNAVAMQAVEEITKNKNEWGSWMGRVANTERPQDYMDIDIEGNGKQHRVACMINVYNADKVIHVANYPFNTNPDNMEQSVKEGMQSAIAAFDNDIKEVVDRFDTAFGFPMRIYGQNMRYSVFEHDDKLTEAKYKYLQDKLAEYERLQNQDNSIPFTESQLEKRRLLVDMDGTLAEFKSVDTMETLYEKDYFLNLEPNENVVEAVRQLLKTHPEVEVYIMSSVLSDSKYALSEKNAWLDKYLPEIDAAHRIFPPCGENKLDYVPDGIRATDCLLDDYTKNLVQWEPPAKGIKLLNGINHTKQTWDGNMLRFDKNPNTLSEDIASIVAGGIFIRDDIPQKAESSLNADIMELKAGHQRLLDSFHDLTSILQKAVPNFGTEIPEQEEEQEQKEETDMKKGKEYRILPVPPQISPQPKSPKL